MLAFAEEHGVENANTLRKQELMFAVLKQLAAKEIEITGIGVVEVLQDGFGFLRSPDANYLPGPDDIYISPVADPEVRPAHGRYGRRPDPQPEGGRALLRLAEGQRDQLRGSRADPSQGQLRQSDAALPDQVAEDGNRVRGGSDQSRISRRRVIDIHPWHPMGKGQRALIVAQPRTGKTVLLQNIAHAITRPTIPSAT